MRGKCFNCDQYGHRKAECPTIKCFRCNRLGHMASNCTGYSSFHSPYPEDDRGDLPRAEGTLSRSRSTVNLSGRGRSASRGRTFYPPPRFVSAECELQQKDTTLRQKECELQEKEKALQQQAQEIQQKQIRLAWEEEERKRREKVEKRRREEEEEERRKEEEEKKRKEEEKRRREEKALQQQAQEIQQKQIRLAWEEEERKRREKVEKRRREEEERRKEEEEKRRKEEEEKERKKREEKVKLSTHPAQRPFIKPPVAPKPVISVTSQRKQTDLPTVSVFRDAARVPRKNDVFITKTSPNLAFRHQGTDGNSAPIDHHVRQDSATRQPCPLSSQPTGQSSSTMFSALQQFWGSAEASTDDALIASTYDAPSRTKTEDRAEPLQKVKFKLSTLECRVIEKFYHGELKELASMSKGRGTVTLQTSSHGSTGMEVTCDNVFQITQKVSEIKQAIRENSGIWKLSSSSTFAKLPASQHTLVVIGTQMIGAKSLSTTVETTLECQHVFNTVLDVTVIPPSRDLSNMVTVTAGSITAVATVDVLVSVVDHDLNMRETSVGQAILNSCGEQQAKELRRSVRAMVDQISEFGQSVIRTKVPEGTKLPATSFILHAVLNTYQEGGHLEVKKIVTDCLTVAANEGLKKLAFPPLGVGRRFAYPVAAVARSMVSATLDFLRTPTSIKRVIFATNDTSVASVFNRELQEQTTAMMEQPCPKGTSFKEITGDVVITIVGKDKGDMPRAAGFLSAILRGIFLSQVTVCDAAEFHELAPAVTAVIQAAAADKCVRLQEKGDEGETMKLVAFGTAENSQNIADLVKIKIYEGLRNKPRELSFVNTHFLPSYWQLNQDYGSIQEAMAGLDQRQKKFVMYNVDSTEFREIMNLMNRTWKHGVVGVGKDARNLGHTSIQIVRVCRLENPELWEKYSERREKLLRRLKKSHGHRLLSLEEMAGNSSPVLTTNAISSGSVLRRDLFSEINEHYLFHGTKDECLVAIERDGLDGRFSKERPLLGRGVYAAESPTKADQYTDPSKLDRTGGPKTMLLVRMLLGEPHINTDRSPPKFSRPPCKGCLQLLCDCQHATHYDSVVDDAGRLFREFVVYEQCQCYPEYIITYNRV